MSTNYYDAIARTLATIDASDRKVRVAFYDRARALLVERLGSLDPPMPEADFAAELADFEAAIARVENEYSRPPTPAVAPPVVARGPEPRARVVDRAGSVAAKPGASRAGVRVAIAAAVAAAAVVGGGLVWRLLQDSAPAPVAVRPSPPVTAADTTRKPSNDAVLVSVDKLPYVLRRQVVYYRSAHPAGTIVITKSQHFLYVVKSSSAALRYTIALGSDCVDSAGLYSVARKDGPQPPAQSGTAHMLLLDKADYRIRATDVLAAIGQDSPSQGFQLMRDDIADLHDRTPLGTRVIVTN